MLRNLQTKKKMQRVVCQKSPVLAVSDFVIIKAVDGDALSLGQRNMLMIMLQMALYENMLELLISWVLNQI